MNGMSPTNKALLAPRATARACINISSMPTGRVVACPSITIPRLSPTSSTSTPASSSVCALHQSYAVSTAKRRPSSLAFCRSDTLTMPCLHLHSSPRWLNAMPRFAATSPYALPPWLPLILPWAISLPPHWATSGGLCTSLRLSVPASRPLPVLPTKNSKRRSTPPRPCATKSFSLSSPRSPPP